MRKKLESVYFRILKELDRGLILSRRLEEDIDDPYQQLLAIGKSSALMAAVAISYCTWPRRGFVITKEGYLSSRYREKLWGIECWEAEHPLPGRRSLLASQRLMCWLDEVPNKGRLLVLLSGGTSSLLEEPRPPLTIADLARLNRSLLASGLEIEEINILRKHLSLVKGGFLGQVIARRFSRVTQLVMGDVCLPNLKARLDLVGSGPTLADPTTVQEARAVLQGLEATLPPLLVRKCQQALKETPKALPLSAELIADHHRVGELAREYLGDLTKQHSKWPEFIDGEVAKLAAVWAKTALELQSEGFEGVLVATGEPTVKLSDETVGEGGRCQELALRFARKIAGSVGITLLCASTDGGDGPTPYAGAVVDGHSWPIIEKGPYREQAVELLKGHYSSRLLSSVPNALIETGPSGHNLNDVFLLAIRAPS